MKNYLTEHIIKTMGWQLGIHRGKRTYCFLVSSKTGEKYRPWVGIVNAAAILACMTVIFLATLGIAAVPATYGIKYWPVSLVLTVLTALCGMGTKRLHEAFVLNPDFCKED